MVPCFPPIFVLCKRWRRLIGVSAALTLLELASRKASAPDLCVLCPHYSTCTSVCSKDQVPSQIWKYCQPFWKSFSLDILMNILISHFVPQLPVIFFRFLFSCLCLQLNLMQKWFCITKLFVSRWPQKLVLPRRMDVCTIVSYIFHWLPGQLLENCNSCCLRGVC